MAARLMAARRMTARRMAARLMTATMTVVVAMAEWEVTVAMAAVRMEVVSGEVALWRQGW